ncbi:hypothetical protein [Streptomyces sp. CC77]|uniref:hypothetical protein n=1 Tax=Streptomyces sp. CC77 TaxID=1906739 RepID=UPI0008DD44DD|nr:hypothetical protein [Streptomyces sp. CC77]OII68943.1 hypothetical protein BJP39_19375 [Streptomyces sp. CC77]
MADERYGWLDQQAAERLLRGEPVVADDDYVRLQAERLAEALEGVRTARTPSPGPAGELPGEDRALGAFRAARAEAGSTARDAAPAPSTEELDAVHIGGTAARPLRRPRSGRWLRPARWGLAASVAGLAVGGVAVAAGTGVLPALGGDPEPVPVASASATPGPRVAGEPTASLPGARTPSSSADRATPAPDPSAPLTHGPSPTGEPAVGPTSDNDGAAPAPSRGDTVREQEGTAAGAGTKAPEPDWQTRVTQACRDLRDGDLDAERRGQLESAARSRGGVQKFCDQVLGGRQGGGTTAPGGGGDRDGDSEPDGDRDRPGAKHGRERPAGAGGPAANPGPPSGKR